MSSSPVVLNIGCWRNIVPVSSRFDGILVVRLRVAEQKVGIIQPAGDGSRSRTSSWRGERTVKTKAALGFCKIVLRLFVERPTEAKLKLVCSFGPGKVVANLVVIRGIVPRRPVGRIEASRAPGQMNVRDAIEGIRSVKYAIRTFRKAGRRREYALRQEGNPIAIIVEGNLVEQRWADYIGGVYNRAVGGIAKRVENSGDIVAAPLRGSVSLDSLVGNPVAEY